MNSPATNGSYCLEQGGNAPSESQPTHPGHAEWCIGADPSCAIRIRASAGRIARLVKRGPRLFIQNFDTDQDVLLDGDRLPHRTERELTRHADLNVAGTAIVLEPRHFVGDARLGIVTSRLRYLQVTGRTERVLCEDLFLRAKPGTFTAILGPVGCGKSIFLNLLNGDLKPASGRIMIGEQFELHRHCNELRHAVAYLPQDDLLIPELTVRQSLDCRLRLRFPDMARRVRQELIQEACRQVGVERSDLEAFLGTIIGCAKSGHRGLSGGERKRASIAHELLLKPLILILDEPTSGLSSIDADKVIRLLGDLATQQGITVVASLHQPSATSFEIFDDLLVMTRGGRLAYYGPASSARGYLERASETPGVPVLNPAEFILSLLAKRGEGERLVDYYRAHPLVFPLDAETEANLELSRGVRSPGLATPRYFGAKLGTLLRRNFCVLRSDQPNLWLTFGQVPVIALVMIMAFSGFQHDGAGTEELIRKAYLFSAGKESYQRMGQPVPVERLIEQSDPRNAGRMISVPAAHRRGAVYFILVAASVWFGILGGCREVVAERHILSREHGIGLPIGAYLAGKSIVLIVVSGLQTGLLAMLAIPVLLAQPWTAALGTWSILWLVAIASATLGLLVSCVAPSHRFALTAVPLLMIPQMILGGMLRPEADMRKDQAMQRSLGWLTIQRWGFEASLSMDPYAKTGVMIQEYVADAGSRYGALDWARFREGNLPQCFFTPKSQLASAALPAASLVLAGGVFLGIAQQQLSRSLSRRQPNRL